MVQQPENISHPSRKIRIIWVVVIVFLNMIIVSGILFAGLWPFNFLPENGCVADFTTGRLLFEKNGLAYSKIDISPHRSLIKDSVFSVAFRAQPFNSPVHCATILAAYSNKGLVLTINQWKTTLIVQSGEGRVVFGETMNAKYQVFVAVSIDESTLTVLCNDKTKKVPIDYADMKSGILKYVILGNNASLRSPWMGELVSISFNSSKDAFGRIQVPRQLIPIQAKMLTPPWEDIRMEQRYALDLIVNLIGFVPLGLSLSLMLNVVFSMSNFRYLVTITVFLTSLFIETAQAYLITRTSQMSDLILNSWGGVLGVVLYVILKRVILESKSFKNHR